VTKVLSHRLYPKRLMSNTSNVALCLHNRSKKTQGDTDADEPPFVASIEIVLNVEPICGSVSVGDVVADAGFVSSVDP
jgi:hypothetical protein